MSSSFEHRATRSGALSVTFGALGDSTFRRVLGSGGAYYTYRAAELAVLSWFVLTVTDSELMVALVGVSRIAPMFLFGLVAGWLSDRFRRPHLMAAGQLSNLAAAVVMVVLFATGTAAAWHAYLLIFVTGATWALDYAARRALLGDLFSGRALTNAISLDASLVEGTNMLGPLLGTALIRVADFEGAYGGIILLTTASLAFALSVRVPPSQRRTDTGGGSPLAQVQATLSLLRSNRTVLGALLVTVTFNVFGWPFLLMVPVIARDELAVGEVFFGLLLSTLGLGSFLGALALAWARPARRGAVYTGGTFLFMAAVASFAVSPTYPLAITAMFVAGLGVAGFGVMQPAIPLEAVAADQRGRAMGAIALGVGFQAAGMTLAGLFAEAVGPRTAVAAMAIGGMAAVGLLRSLFPVLRDAPARSSAGPAG